MATPTRYRTRQPQKDTSSFVFVLLILATMFIAYIISQSPNPSSDAVIAQLATGILTGVCGVKLASKRRD